jgi:tetratricopeptide (TPR) repeat protein
VIKLKKTIAHLDTVLFQQVESSFLKNRADNFLFLFRAYRADKLSDAEISQALMLSSNSFYVLKSRLYDKVQEVLSGDVHLNKEDVIRMIHKIPEMCFSNSREVSTAFLLKLEKDLMHFDMHNELLMVYSALKKINLYSEKYFHYSQLYNKHMAYSMSLEKSEEILGNFNRALGQYMFSRSSIHLEELQFLLKGINDHLALNQSRQIEVIRNLIEIQLDIFCDVRQNDKSTEENLRITEKVLFELPDSSTYKSWRPALDYLFFEYFRKIGDSKMVLQYFEKVDASRKTLLLYNSTCLTSYFLISRIIYLQTTGKTELLTEEDEKSLLFDENDTCAVIIMGIYKAMIRFYRKQVKEATAVLNNVLNLNSFKDFFHINTEIRLNLAYFYLIQKEYDLAANILKNIQRKVKAEKHTQYANVLDLIKVFSSDIKNIGQKPEAKLKDSFLIFTGRNKNEQRILQYLLFELEHRYS